MPRTRVREDVVYRFSELSDKAKDKAREWYREGNLDSEWWDSVYEDAEQIAKILGIDIRQRAVPLMNGKTRSEPVIYFSGFSSQGDGACFDGGYRYSKGWRKKLKDYAPQDKELFEIGEALTEAQRQVQWTGTASIKQSGRYYHSGCMDVSCDCDGGIDASDGWEDIITQCMKDFADWIYQRLEAEYDYLNSDESVDESIDANEYEFTSEGRPA